MWHTLRDTRGNQITTSHQFWAPALWSPSSKLLCSVNPILIPFFSITSDDSFFMQLLSLSYSVFPLCIQVSHTCVTSSLYSIISVEITLLNNGFHLPVKSWQKLGYFKKSQYKYKRIILWCIKFFLTWYTPISRHFWVKFVIISDWEYILFSKHISKRIGIYKLGQSHLFGCWF